MAFKYRTFTVPLVVTPEQATQIALDALAETERRKRVLRDTMRQMEAYFSGERDMKKTKGKGKGGKGYGC